MKHLIILLALLTSCSSDWHLRRAKFKQPNILQQYNDTIRLKNVRTDTIYYADTFAVVHTITEHDTIIETRYLKPETRYQIRHKRKETKDSLKHVLKLYETKMDALNDSIVEMADLIKYLSKQDTKQNKQDNKTEQKKNRKLWWIWLLIGSFAGIFAYRWVKSLF